MSYDYLPHLLEKADRLILDTRFYLSSVPNVDIERGSGLARQLQASRSILTDLKDYSLLTKSEIEECRLWRDVRRDTLEFFRQLFSQLEKEELLDTDCKTHLTALFLVYHPRIQKSLDETTTSWNNHSLRTERYKTPFALYELSKERAINAGYWDFDAGDNVSNVGDDYGEEGDEPGAEDSQPVPPRSDYFETLDDEIEAGIVTTDDEVLSEARDALGGMDLEKDDGAWGIDTYCEVVLRLTAFYSQKD
ncbi:hypothetical protein DFP72DRAFT_823198 [Ephemerocybe angulata]|uniref:Integrase core domain-containing protein n=1 Tax=Ephemerocybe angulata TaxID=980116 RepID=A0A8H6HG42_9AGAR|nr:hypothetical protein DFP72DRAFT_823198 [Tulosesus angulatus]